jgi:hypothetical protein
MNESLKYRLNKIMDRIQSPAFLSNTGLGNEIGFYIFDYPPEDELVVREYVRFMLDTLAKKNPDLKIAHINLFRLLINYLKERGIYERALDIQKTKGDEALGKALKGPLHEEKIASAFVDAAQPDKHDVSATSGLYSGRIPC